MAFFSRLCQVYEQILFLAELFQFDTYSMKQPDLYYFETIKNDATSLVKFCLENTSRRRVFSVNFDKACDVICMVSK